MNNKVLKVFNEEQATNAQIANLRVRNAVRIVLIDDNSHVAIIHAKNMGYYSLPGGGVEKATDKEINDALIRETKEETGCDIKKPKKLGIVDEIRLKDNLLNRSFGYLAEVQGQKGSLLLNKDEIDEGFELKWASIDEAINLIGNYSPELNLYHKYFLEREITFLKQAIKINPSLSS